MKYSLLLLVVLNILGIGKAYGEEVDCRDHVTVPQLWRRYHSQVGDSVPKIHAKVTSTHPDCEVISYNISPSTPGLVMEEDGLIDVETVVPIEDTDVTITAQVGSQTIIIANMTLSVYDCLPGVQLTELKSSYSVQQDGVLPTINLRAKLAKDVDEDCRISYYKIVGKTQQMTVDEQKGELTIDTSGPITESVKAQVVIGSQVYTSGSFSLEIFNCNDVISFPDLLSRYMFQFGDIIGGIQMQAQSSKSSKCIIQSYALEGETQGTTMDPLTGVVSVDTSAVISPSPRKISVKVGSQTMISPEFSFEIFDCRSYIQFAEGLLKQVGSTTSVFPAIKSISRKQCKATSFSIKEPIEGISIDANSGEITLSTRKVIPRSQLTVEAVVGSQTVTNQQVIELEVYDCTADLTFAPSIVAQVDQPTQRFMSVTINKPREECKDFTYSLTGSPIGIQMNEETSEIIVQTTQAIKKTTHEVTVSVGSQQMQSPSFDIEVFDCKIGLLYALDIVIQVGSTAKSLDVLQNKPPHPNCATIQYANVKGLKDGIRLNAEGILKVDTFKEIEMSILEVDVIIGVQQFKIDQKIEVFDCLSKIEFLKQYQAQLQSDPKRVDTVVKHKRKEDCAIQSFATISAPPGFTVNVNTGKMMISTDVVIEEQLQIEAKVGSQIASYFVKMSIYTCESKIKFSDGLKVQKDTGIQTFVALIQDDEEEEDKVVEEKDYKTKHCFKSNYKLTQSVKGVKINSKNGEITVDTSEKLDKALLQVSVNVGSQVFESEALNVEVFDCNDYVSLPIIKDAINFQRDLKVDPLSFAATITMPECKVDKYSLEKEVQGLTFDQTNGELSVDTSIAFEPTDLSVSLKIGSQVMTTKSFKFEVYDCLTGISFPNLKKIYNFQKKVGETQEVDAEPESSRKDCIIGPFFFSELPEGISIVENRGKLVIDTSSSIQETQNQLQATIGSQIIKSPRFSMQVFDCAEIIKFTNSQKVQLDEPTKVISVIQDNANIDYCGKVKFSVEGLVDGLRMNLETGDLTIQTDKAIPNTALNVIVEVGEQKFTSPPLEFEVFDCKQFVSKPTPEEKYRYQVDSTIPVLDMPFQSTFAQCVINSYDLSGQTQGISVDSATAQITISNEKEIKPTKMHLYARVGTQTISTEKFTIEVWDCNRYLTFIKDQYHQIDPSQNQVLASMTSNDNPTDCVVSSFKASGIKEGISIEEESGEITVVTENAIEKTDLQLEVVAGTQTIFPPKFLIEVYDCSQAIKFVKSPRFQVSSESQSFNIIASNSRPKLCGDYTMTLAENTSPAITKGEKRGQIVVDTTKELAKTALDIVLKVGVQELPYKFADMEVYDCNNFVELPKLKESYRYQVNQTIPSIVGSFKSIASEDCVLSTYSLTQKVDQVSIRSLSGTIKIGNLKSIPETKLQIVAKVGSQNIKSESFVILVYDCVLEISQPHLWNNHIAQANGVGYQLQKNVIIDTRPETKLKEDCPITSYNVTGNIDHGVTINQDTGIVEVDKDVVTTVIQLKTTVFVGSQQIDLPYITIQPRKDLRGINFFAIINSVIFLILVLVACILCFCCRKQKQDEEEQNKLLAAKRKNEAKQKAAARKNEMKLKDVERKPVIIETPKDIEQEQMEIVSQATDAVPPAISPVDSIDDLQFDEEQIPVESNSVDNLTGSNVQNKNISQTRQPKKKKWTSQVEFNGSSVLS